MLFYLLYIYDVPVLKTHWSRGSAENADSETESIHRSLEPPYSLTKYMDAMFWAVPGSFSLQ